MNVAKLLGRVEVAKGFAPFDQQNRGIDRQAFKLDRIGVDLVHCPQRPGDRDKDDETMQEHIRRTLEQRPEIQRYVLCTGDHGFARVVKRIRAKGRVAFVIGPPDAVSRELAEAATVCLTVPVLGQGNGQRQGVQRLEVKGRTDDGNGHHWWRNRVERLPPLQRPGLSVVP